jgi:hypothetical protein
MKNIIPILLITVLALSCKDKDEDNDKSTMYDNCCQELFSDSSNFVLYLPNAFTPDGDALNEEFAVATPAHGKVLYVTDVQIKDYESHVVYTKDTLLDASQHVINPDQWDFKHDNELVLGTIDVSMKVTDIDSNTHSVNYKACVYTCQSLKDNEVTLDFSKCWMEDQIDIRKGFVLQSTETRCP